MAKQKTLMVCIILGSFFSALYADPAPEAETIRISSFNIRIFGVTKMSKPEVAGILVDMVSR
ncbi:MAG: endonuclease, partial [Spirochaetaceae bacterium]|nr:endonuclease [Spirochaetaceae bacterium]